MSNLDRLVELVKKAVDSSKSQQPSILRGVIAGSFVSVADGTYPYTVVVDEPMNDGDYVYVILSKQKAVVVGK